MANMEDLLMLSGDSSGSDSDAEDNASASKAVAKASTAASTTTTVAPPSTAAPKPKQPPLVAAASKSVGGPQGQGILQRSDSKSTLTNRLKSLYTSSAPPKTTLTKAQPKPSGPAAAGAAPARRSAGAPIPATAARNAAPNPLAASSASRAPPPTAPGGGHNAANNPNYVPPMVHTNHTHGSPQKQQQQHQQQQHPQPGHGGQHGSIRPGPVPQPVQQSTVGRVPAPLPTARTSNPLSTPPNNRIASVPVSSSSRPRGAVAPVVNIPTTVGPPPPSPMTTTSQNLQQHSQGQQARGSTTSRKQQYVHAPHLQRGAGKQQQQQHGQPPQRQQQHTLVPPRTQTTQTASSSSRRNAPNVMPQMRSSSGSGGVELTDQEKKEKERFLMLTRVLMKYLEQRDVKMHAAAKAQIKECYEKNKSGDPKFECLTTSMKVSLRSTVGESYWKKAHDYLDHFLKQKMVNNQKLMAKQAGQGGQVQQRPHHPQQQPPQIMSGRPQPGAAPPPIVRTEAPRQSANTQHQQQPNVMAQSQMPTLAAKKTPIAANSSRSGLVATNPPGTITVSAPSAATAEQKKVQEDQKKKDEAAKKKQLAEERKAARNEKARQNRARKKKKEEEARLAKQRAEGGATNLGVSARVQSAPSAVAAPTGLSTGGNAVNLPNEMGIQHPLQHSNSGLSTAATIGSVGPAPTTSGVTTPSSASVSSTASSKAKDKKVDPPVKKKITKKKYTSTTSKPPSAITRRNSLTKEPNKLMATIDHAILIDVKTIPTLISKEHKFDFNLDEEQRILLYGGERKCVKVKDTTKTASAALDLEMKDTKMKEVGVQPLPWKIPDIYDGWGKKNVLSVRSAWAKVRLPESEVQHLESVKSDGEAQREQGDQMQSMSKSLSGVDAMGGFVDRVSSRMEAPATSSFKTQKSSSLAPTIEDDTTNHVWFNETRAGQDPTLALISEATELFLKSTIEKAISQARLRQNLDGVRLWHTLHARSSVNPAAAVNCTDKKGPPAALIRLGCDVRRQIALAEGNAAKTYQRMEEAITRQNEKTYRTSNLAHNNPDTMLLDATSMGDLSRKPPLKSATHVADMDAKRKYAVFGGINSQDPPFGRVPKKAKVTLQDIVVGELENRTSMVGARRKRFRLGLKY